MNKAPLAVCLAMGTLVLAGCESFELHAQTIDRSVAMATAMQQKDIEMLERLMAPDFRLTLEEIPPFALTVDQGNPAPGLPGWRWRENLQGMSFGRITMSSIDTIQLADDLMAVNIRMTLEEWTATDERGTGDLSGSYDLTDIWVNRDGEWRIISRYSRPVGGLEIDPSPDFVIDQ